MFEDTIPSTIPRRSLNACVKCGFSKSFSFVLQPHAHLVIANLCVADGAVNKWIFFATFLVWPT